MRSTRTRGLILPLGGGVELMVAPYWKCLAGHKWKAVGVPCPGYPTKQCSRCSKKEQYSLVNSGMSKAWMWI